MPKPLIEVKNLKTYFFSRYGVTKAVDGVSFHVNEGETLALLGESGCGKTITCLSLMRLVPSPGRIVEGEIIFEGRDLVKIPIDEMRDIRGRLISLVMQDPMTTLNPVLNVGSQVAEPLTTHLAIGDEDVKTKVKELLELVRIASPEVQVNQYPHQLSGGMKQRISIATALTCEPRLVLADEPTSALDVTTQMQILMLLQGLQDRFGMAIVLVTHDFNIVAKTADRVAVMYAGGIMEVAKTKEILDNPLHPYTVGLRDCIPSLGQKRERLFSIPGQPPDLVDPPVGCAFVPRCNRAQERCKAEKPPTVAVGDDHIVNCWCYND